jgi:spermidine synthase
MAAKGRLDEGIIPGRYTRLTRDDGTIVMSDTISERRDHVGFVEAAHGLVLIHGLGLGMTIEPVLDKLEVDHVIVVEKEQDVLDLVAPTYLQRYPQRLTIVKADAFDFALAVCPDVVWNDIWDFVDDRNVPEMDHLEDRYAEASWCSSWARDRCEAFDDYVQHELYGASPEVLMERLSAIGMTLKKE